MAEHPLLFPDYTPVDKVVPDISPVQRQNHPFTDPWGKTTGVKSSFFTLILESVNNEDWTPRFSDNFNEHDHIWRRGSQAPRERRPCEAACYEMQLSVYGACHLVNKFTILLHVEQYYLIFAPHCLKMQFHFAIAGPFPHLHDTFNI